MSTATIPIFDAAQLNRATNGDPALQVEVLALFTAEVERLMRQVEDADEAEVRSDRLRALIALARNTGAALLANEARKLETQIGSDSPDLRPLNEAVEATLAYVKKAGL